MMQGEVTKFFSSKGFGFIAYKDGVETKDAFVHFTDILGGEPRLLIPGESVEFELGSGRDGRAKAVQVRRLTPRLQGVVESFQHQKGIGFLLADGGERLFVHYRDIISSHQVKSLADGERVEFELSPEIAQQGGCRKAVRVVQLDTRPPLERFAWLPNFDGQLAHLSGLAQPEKWQYPRSPHPRDNFPILRSFIYYTFVRLREEGKIAEVSTTSGGLSCFNTGLVTPRQEDIFAVFHTRTGQGTQPWQLDGFYKESDYKLGEFPSRPDIAEYFVDPSDLLYDAKRELVVDFDHVIEDNRDRFPADMRAESFLRTALEGAINWAKKRVRRNYKTAIPQYHRGRLQLLLPLCLRTPDRADLALVVSREHEVYRGSTVLTLDMAYNNARLIARPDTEWLVP